MINDKEFIQNAVIKCVFTVTALLLLATGAYLLQMVVTRGKAESAALISTCANQKMLSQRAAMLVLSLASTRDANLQLKIREDLHDIVNSLDKAHRQLSRGSDTSTPSAAIMSIYFEPPVTLDHSMGRFIGELRKLIEQPIELYTFDNRHLFFIAAGSTDLLSKLDIVTEQFRREAEAGIQQLADLQLLLFLLNTLVILAAGLFIFRPLIMHLQVELAMRRQLLESLEASRRQLEHRGQELKLVNQQLEEFTGMVAHDLRAPLQNIQGISSFIQRRASALADSELLEFGNHLKATVKRMDLLVRDLLNYAHITLTRGKFEPVLLQTIVNEILSDIKLTIDQNQAKITCQPLPIVHADRVQMRQLFQNIIQNSLKYRHPERTPEINISWQTSALGEREFAQITISDNGVGFNPGEEKRMFKMFERLHDMDVADGIGMGLATCLNIVRRHSGTISAAGTPNRGCQITFTIPLNRQGSLPKVDAPVVVGA